MEPATHIIRNCVGLLEQAIELVKRIETDVYVSLSPLSPRGSIGGHLRHIIDFYRSFLVGIGSGRINYNLRQRDVLIERDRAHAIKRLGEVIESLQSLLPLDGESLLSVSTEEQLAGGRGRRQEQELDDAAVWCRSTVLRELDFLQSHTVHHYSLVAMLLRLHVIEPGEEFGVAPSTLKYWKQEAACAQ